MTTENQGVFVQASNTTQSLGAGGLGTLTVALAASIGVVLLLLLLLQHKNVSENAEGGKEVTRG